MISGKPRSLVTVRKVRKGRILGNEVYVSRIFEVWYYKQGVDDLAKKDKITIFLIVILIQIVNCIILSQFQHASQTKPDLK